MKLTNFLSLIVLLLFISVLGHAQNEQRTFILDSGKLEATLTKKESAQNGNAKKWYHFVNANKYITLQGAFDGYLLNGSANFYDKKNNLIERGKFKRGLKSGPWYHWNTAGELVKVMHWKKGLVSGSFRQVLTDGIIETGKFKKGKRHGKWLLLKGDEQIKVTNYDMGEVTILKQEHDITPLKEKPEDESKLEK